MKIMCFDPATETGWAFYDGTDIVRAGAFIAGPLNSRGTKIKQSCTIGERFDYYMRHVDRLVNELMGGEGEKRIVVESAVRGSFKTAKMLGFYNGYLHAVASRLDTPISEFNPSEWKRGVIGDGSADSGDHKKPRSCKEAFRRYPGLFGNNPTTVNPNIADAINILRHAITVFSS